MSTSPWRNPTLWFAIFLGITVVFGGLGVALESRPAAASLCMYPMLGGLCGAALIAIVVTAHRVLSKAWKGVVALRERDRATLIADARDLWAALWAVVALLVFVGLLLGGAIGLIGGIRWCVEQYESGPGLLGVPYLGGHICASRMQDAFSAIAPERDPKVTKCIMLQEPNSGAKHPDFMCITQVLDPDGEYRSVACRSYCEMNGERWAHSLRENGVTLDDICPRKR